MSNDDFTPERLLEFLRQSPAQGLLNSAVAKSRYTAVEQLFTELSESEKRDIRLINVDDLCSRLHKIQDSTIRPEVVALYNSRVKAALTDYLAWQKNPKTFASIGGDLVRRDKHNGLHDKERAAETAALEDIRLSTSERRPDLVSIPLRPDVTVYVANMPLDLSAQEARKISRVLEAFAAPGEEDNSDAL